MSAHVFTVSIDPPLFNWLTSIANREKLAGPDVALVYLANLQRQQDTGRVVIGEAYSVTFLRTMIKENPNKSISELQALSGYTAQTVRTVIAKLLRAGEITQGAQPPPDYDRRAFPIGRPASVFVLTPAGQDRIDRMAKEKEIAEAKRREDSKPFSVKLAEAAEQKTTTIANMRGAMIAFDTLDQEFNAGLHAAKEEGPYRELQAELARRGEVFKAAWAACSEWPTERQKVIDDHRKAQALASALDVD